VKRTVGVRVIANKQSSLEKIFDKFEKKHKKVMPIHREGDWFLDLIEKEEYNQLKQQILQREKDIAKSIFDDIEELQNRKGIAMIISQTGFHELKKKWLK